jgi:hypothetical protein
MLLWVDQQRQQQQWTAEHAQLGGWLWAQRATALSQAAIAGAQQRVWSYLYLYRTWCASGPVCAAS